MENLGIHESRWSRIGRSGLAMISRDASSRTWFHGSDLLAGVSDSSTNDTFTLSCGLLRFPLLPHTARIPRKLDLATVVPDHLALGNSETQLPIG